jgi:uncharacterized SAM-binding protein YcdF (DUF218 family)
VLAAVAAVALWNGAEFYRLLWSGKVASSFPLPSSLPIAAVLLLNAARVWREHASGARVEAGDGRVSRALVHGAGVALAGGLGPLLLLCCYGTTSYAGFTDDRPADFVIVYGAKVYDDGTPSLCLRDRVNEGVRQWRAGAGRVIVMSGGVGRNGVSEPEVMKRLAVGAGVPPGAILTDESGTNTRGSVSTMDRLAAERGWRRSVSVSHYYHLLRIQMTARRAGLVTYTVPAYMTRRLAREPWFVFREVLALYGYYLLEW